MVVCAVICEPVSTCNSLLTGKTTGNFSKLASLSDFSYAKPHALQRLQCRFPTQNNRENNCRIRENFAQEQGCFRNSGGGKAPAHQPPSIAFPKWASMFPPYRSVSVGGSFWRYRRAVWTTVLGTRDRTFALFYGHTILGKPVNAPSLQNRRSC
jgi:hypothetical protein